eukprot:6468995-Amphidinium_carterae.1
MSHSAHIITRLQRPTALTSSESSSAEFTSVASERERAGTRRQQPQNCPEEQRDRHPQPRQLSPKNFESTAIGKEHFDKFLN